MQKYINFILFFLIFNFTKAQELNCSVSVNSSKVTGSNKQVFKTLEKSIADLMNQTKWTKKTYQKQEKIQCVLNLTITEKTGPKKFEGIMQVQSVRPIYNSTYKSPLLNYQDVNFSFVYEEFQTLLYNESSFESNLTSLLSFYAHLIIGFDADSFSADGGDIHYKTAEKIMLTAQQGGYKGWKSIDGNKSRFQLISDLLNSSYLNFRSMLYTYHLKGLDQMHKDPKKAKRTISNSIISLQSIHRKKPSAFILRIFSDTKADEIESIFKDGPTLDITKLKNTLLRIYPAKSNNWKKIK